MGCYFSLSWLLWARLPFQGPSTHCWASDSLFLPLGPNGLFQLFIVNLLWPSSLGFSFHRAFHKWPSTVPNELINEYKIENIESMKIFFLWLFKARKFEIFYFVYNEVWRMLPLNKQWCSILKIIINNGALLNLEIALFLDWDSI